MPHNAAKDSGREHTCLDVSTAIAFTHPSTASEPPREMSLPVCDAIRLNLN